jgi:hypothetical protein
MSTTSLPRIPIDIAQGDEAKLQVIIAFNQAMDELDYLLGGFLDSKNAREFGGWLVGQTELQSKDKKVGMSTNKNGADPVRFWAGDFITGSPNFKVTAAGILTAVGALLMSALGYPRVEINSASKLIAAYQSATQFIQILADMAGQPEIYFQNGSSVSGSIATTPSAINFSTPAGKGDISISSGQALNLFAQALINVSSWSQLYSTSAGKTLQTELNAKANGSGLNGTVYVATTPGGPANTAITFSNGVRIS